MVGWLGFVNRERNGSTWVLSNTLVPRIPSIRRSQRIIMGFDGLLVESYSPSEEFFEQEHDSRDDGCPHGGVFG